MAQDKSVSPNAEERASAIQLGKASMRVSIAGLIVGAAVGFIFVILQIAATSYSSSHHY